MPADDRFAERIRRIETGRTWKSDGIEAAPGAGRAPLLGPRRLFWLALLAGLRAVFLKPELLTGAMSAPWVADAAARASALPVLSNVLASMTGG